MSGEARKEHCGSRWRRRCWCPQGEGRNGRPATAAPRDDAERQGRRRAPGAAVLRRWPSRAGVTSPSVALGVHRGRRVSAGRGPRSCSDSRWRRDGGRSRGERRPDRRGCGGRASTTAPTDTRTLPWSARGPRIMVPARAGCGRTRDLAPRAIAYGQISASGTTTARARRRLCRGDRRGGLGTLWRVNVVEREYMDHHRSGSHPNLLRVSPDCGDAARRAAPTPLRVAQRPRCPPPSADKTAGRSQRRAERGPMRTEPGLYDRGIARFKPEQYAGAIAEFEAGYAIDRAEFLLPKDRPNGLAATAGRGRVDKHFLATNQPAAGRSDAHAPAVSRNTWRPHEGRMVASPLPAGGARAAPRVARSDGHRRCRRGGRALGVGLVSGSRPRAQDELRCDSQPTRSPLVDAETWRSLRSERGQGAVLTPQASPASSCSTTSGETR